jgi:thiamine biosynthesis lipoprotein
MSPLAEAAGAARSRRARARSPRTSAPAENEIARPSPELAPSRARWRALGTSAELLVLGDRQQLAQARAAVEGWLDLLDRACSRFREDSDLSRLNAVAGRAVEVSPLLIEATQLALRAARLTDGDVDPTLGRALELAGYDRDWELIAAEPDRARVTLPATPSIATAGAPASTSPASPSAMPSRPPFPRPPLSASRLRARRRPRWAAVRVDPVRGTIALPRGVKLDLGATAKAWAADRAAQAAHAASGCGVLVSLGGDIATCGECPPGGWRVHVTDDHRDGPDAPGQTVAISGGGLATSSTAVRRWLLADRRSRRVPRMGYRVPGWVGLPFRYRTPIGGEQMHHIIDPATGDPARSPWRTVSVAAADCADANIAATAAIVRGESAVEWLARAGLPARLVANDGAVARVGAWPEPAGRSPEADGETPEPDGRSPEADGETPEPDERSSETEWRVAEPDGRSPKATGPGLQPAEAHPAGSHTAGPKLAGSLAERLERRR